MADTPGPSTPVNGPRAVRGLQERAARALPAEHVETVHGWWLRYTPGPSWWAGTVLPHGDPGRDMLATRADLAESVAHAEWFYASRGCPSRFQISPSVCSPGLDTYLAERDYRVGSPMSLQVAASVDVRKRTSMSDASVDLTARPTRAWFDAWCAVHGFPDGPEAQWALLARVQHPTAYASVVDGGRTVAVGRAVIDTGIAGVFDMGTVPEARGSGHGRATLGALAGWAASERVERLYLQVEQENTAAMRLYGHAGFVELDTYHYRIAP